MEDQDPKAEAASLIKRVLPADAEAPATARDLVAHLADELPPDLLRDVQLLVSELVLQRVRRRAPGAAGTLGLELSVTGSCVRVQVVDENRGGAAEPAGSQEPVLGWKLEIVAEIADRWGIGGDHLTTVWFELDREYSAPFSNP